MLQSAKKIFHLDRTLVLLFISFLPILLLAGLVTFRAYIQREHIENEINSYINEAQDKKKLPSSRFPNDCQPESQITESSFCKEVAKKIAEQIADANNYKPTATQVKKMIKDPELCFADDDCRFFPQALVDCNLISVKNKYYCMANHGCISTLIGCPYEAYYACVNNRCIIKDLPVKYPQNSPAPLQN